jgi:hypothetical protein
MRDLNAWDPDIAMYRSIGCSPQDPASLDVSNAGGAILNDTGLHYKYASVPVSDTGILVLHANPKRVKAIVQNRTTTPCDVFISALGAFGLGLLMEGLAADVEIDGYMPTTSDLYAIATPGGSTTVSVLEAYYI